MALDIEINLGFEKFKNTDGAILLDVRTEEEYADGHLPQSINISLQTIDKVQDEIEDKDTPIFVYCRSGARSSRAATAMRAMGYTNVKNIGGILDYKGTIER